MVNITFTIIYLYKIILLYYNIFYSNFYIKYLPHNVKKCSSDTWLAEYSIMANIFSPKDQYDKSWIITNI